MTSSADLLIQNYDELKVTELGHHDVPYGHALVQVKAVGLTFVDLLYVCKPFNCYAVFKDFTSFSYDNHSTFIWSLLQPQTTLSAQRQPCHELRLRNSN